MLATAAFLVTGITFAQDANKEKKGCGKECAKGKSCGKDCKGKDCKKDGCDKKDAKTKEVKKA